MPSSWGLQNILLLVVTVLLLPPRISAESLKLGSIGIDPVAETKKFSPLASYLARQLQGEGIDEGRVVVAASIPAMSSFMQTRQVDLYMESFFPSLAVSRLSTANFCSGAGRWEKASTSRLSSREEIAALLDWRTSRARSLPLMNPLVPPVIFFRNNFFWKKDSD